MKIIGISGKMGTGKSTMANFLWLELDARRIRAERMSFGLEVKKESAGRFSFDAMLALTEEGKGQVVFHPDLPGGSMSVRKLLQWWGTDICRKKDSDYWVRALQKSIEKRDFPQGTVIVIDDVRFHNEADFVKQHDGYLVRLETYPGWEPGPHAGHDSETALDKYRDWDRTLAPEYGQLLKAAQDVIDEWQKKMIRNDEGN